MTVELLKRVEDEIIDRSHGQSFKAVHLAEILFRDRTTPGGLDLRDRESYRCASRRWRDEVCERLIGASSTSNTAWQDVVLPRWAPAETLAELAAENRRLKGAIEADIYRRIAGVRLAIARLAADLDRPDTGKFVLAEFLRHVRSEPVLQRVIGRVYEIVAFAVLDTLVEALNVQVSVDLLVERAELLNDEGRFMSTVLRTAPAALPLRMAGRMSRVGVAHAADGGVDLISNFGFRGQVKHAVLKRARIQTLVDPAADLVDVLICRSVVAGRGDTPVDDATVITEADLVNWSDRIAGGAFGTTASAGLRKRIAVELRREFPGCQPDAFPAFLCERGYDTMPTWQAAAAS